MWRHHRDIGEKDFLFFFRTGLFVGEFDARFELCFKGEFVFFGVVFVKGWRCQMERYKIELKLFARVVLDRGKFFKCFLEPLFDEPVVAIDLVLDKVGEFDQRFFVLRKILFWACEGLGFTHNYMYINAKIADTLMRGGS